MHIVAAISFVLATAGIPPVVAAAFSTYVTHSLERRGPDDAPPRDAGHAIEVSAAANEFEGVHLVIGGGQNGLRAVNLSLTGPLTRSDGTFIDPRNLRFYREHYVSVTTPSEGKGERGTYPDALIPLRNPFTGEALGTTSYPAAPFDVKPLKSQAVYVEFFVLPETRPGTYTGTIQITDGSSVVLSAVPVTLRVWNFQLPSTSRLRTNFQSYDANYLLGAVRYMGYENGGAEHRALARAIDELLLEHRLVPESPMDSAFGWNNDGEIRIGMERAARILSIAAKPQYTDFLLSFGREFPFTSPTSSNRTLALNYLRSALEWFRAHGISDKVFVRPGDEPGTTMDYTTIRDLATLAREASPDYRIAMTVDLGDPRVDQYLTGAVNRLIAGYWNFDPQKAAARIAAGDEIWTYTALIQNESKPSPYWQVDFPLLNYRIVAWTNFRYGATGLLYWTSAYWNQMVARQKSPWEDPCNYRLGQVCYNGEGMLVYPGREVNYIVPRQAYGPYSTVPVYGALPSLRLKTLRDAVEDYEYLSIAFSLNPEFVQREVTGVACGAGASSNCFHQWNRDPRSLLGARARLAALIESRSQRERMGPPRR